MKIFDERLLMNMKKILYYTWNEIIYSDVVESLNELGYKVNTLEFSLKDFLYDPEFIQYVENILKREKYDYIFSINYFPIISKIALRNNIFYLAWVYDCPCYSMYSDMVHNPYNYIFHFDKNEVEKFRSKGVKNIFHMPLAVNTKRVKNLVYNNENINPRLYNNSVSFVGSLYSDGKETLINLDDLSEWQKGYIEGLINSQRMIYGYDLISSSISKKFEKEMFNLINFDLDKEIFVTKKELLVQWIQKELTILERNDLLISIAKDYPVALYTQTDCDKFESIENRGIVDYEKEMPLVFNNSKINLNITLRCITSGIPLRCMDVMGAGGFLLSNYQPELAEFFIDGEELVLYEDKEDMLRKINYYLRNEEERKEIAWRGQKKIEKEFSYIIQLQKMFNTMPD